MFKCSLSIFTKMSPAKGDILSQPKMWADNRSKTCPSIGSIRVPFKESNLCMEELPFEKKFTAKSVILGIEFLISSGK